MEEFKKDPKTGACIRTGVSPIKLLNLRLKEHKHKIAELEGEVKYLKNCLTELKMLMIEPQVLARLLNEKVTEVRSDG